MGAIRGEPRCKDCGNKLFNCDYTVPHKLNNMQPSTPEAVNETLTKYKQQAEEKAKKVVDSLINGRK